MILIIGLGNPGEEYEHTPHNLGFYLLDALQDAHHFSAWKQDKNADTLISRGTIGNETILLAKPQTFMNNSGLVAKKLAQRFRVPTKNIWVAHDDADLPFGALKISQGRGSAGHKGVESIIRAFKSKKMTRFRMGSNLKTKHAAGRQLTGVVLKRFSPAQEKTASELATTTARAIESAIANGIPRAMTEYNRR